MKMYKLSLLAFGILAAGLVGFSNLRGGSLKGSISPANGGNRVWIVSSTDTIKAPIDRGSFEVRDIHPGIYRVIIEANPPYKNVARTGITLQDGQMMDLGEIVLMQ
jgi:hypothetical protein